MQKTTSRRLFLASLAAPATLLWSRSARAAEPGSLVAPASGEPSGPVPERFPSQDPLLVREMVGASHGNVDRVKELLAERPTLAKAAWDWGFGDWETALGAASHVGNREIAELLLGHGARPTLFSAAMLGQLEVVRAFVEATPGVQRIHGPHGITLLAHARAGKEQAAAVVRYLEDLGDADPQPVSAPLSPEERARYAGVFVLGSGEADRIEVSESKEVLRFHRVGGSPRGLIYLGENAFHPVGAPAVRIRFLVEAGMVTALSVHDPGLVLTARRTG